MHLNTINGFLKVRLQTVVIKLTASHRHPGILHTEKEHKNCGTQTVKTVKKSKWKLTS